MRDVSGQCGVQEYSAKTYFHLAVLRDRPPDEPYNGDVVPPPKKEEQQQRPADHLLQGRQRLIY
jgi:hypothetical protein